MFSATFFGHQGWLFETESTRFLVDALLTPKFGTPGYEPNVFPPRKFNWSEFPPIDALFLSHEHEDHFYIPSMNMVSRGVPIYLSALSSVAARAALKEMGFEVRLVTPGQPVVVGDLEFHPIAPDHLTSRNHDELDVLIHVVKDTGQSGSFFSAVDVEPSSRILERAKLICDKPGIVCHTNNFLDPSAVAPWLNPNRTAGFLIAGIAANFHVELCEKWGEPEISVHCGRGMSFSGELSWLNQRAFLFDSEKAFETLSTHQPGARFRALVPGETIVMKEGKVVEIRPAAPFLEAGPRASWPDRSFEKIARPESFSPGSGSSAFPSEALDELQRGLNELALFLYDSKFFKTIYSLNADELEGNKPSIAFVLRMSEREGDTVCFAYDPPSCAFLKVQSQDPKAEYLAGIECWATDLLGVIRGTLTAMVFGARSLEWNGFPMSYSPNSNLVREYLMPCYSALRRPQVILQHYRQLIAQQPKEAAVVPAARRK